MSEIAKPSRRNLLKLLGGAPMLPLAGGVSAATLLAACGGDDDDSPSDGGGGNNPPPSQAEFQSATFTATPAPSLSKPADMATTYTTSSMEVTFTDGSKQTVQLAYHPFFKTGDLVPDGNGNMLVAGGYFDNNNEPIYDTSSSVSGSRQFFSDAPDGTSLLTVPDANVTVDGKKVANPVFAVVQFEYNTKNAAGTSTYGQLPSPIAVLTLDQNQETGELKLVKYHNVNMKTAHSLWITCGASLSPWGTHLSSEEYEPDAALLKAGNASVTAQFSAFSQYTFGNDSANPYHYGHLPEITVNPDGTGTVKKHYCLGRISHELIQVMPDNRTALMGDDYTNGGLFMFVADKEKDLSAGTLYVAKYGPGLKLDTTSSAPIGWIKLGHATSAEIEALANAATIDAIMDVVFSDPDDDSYTHMFCDGREQWVKLKAGQDKAGAFLETHRYANLKGGSMAFTKMEGTTVNVKDKVAYSALANIQASMVKNDPAWNAAHNISLDKKLVAGGVLAHKLQGGQKDDTGAAIDSEWVPVSSQFLLLGEDIPADTLGNTANPNKIASPDNLKFSEKLRTLFIGEDSGNHVNNFLWAYNIDTKTLTRILSAPAAAESTGLHAVDEINGWTYIMSNFQHAGDWGGIHANVRATLDPYINANYNNKFSANVGYLTAVDTTKA
ncbi:DUF839 domain-containing protein [Pigmentiphaga soli]|uniref:DUF839 domain-containing protein n=1 Tax=Pigmentiphaga soli TaxID=1007095 RepID=A0ABP8H427_9BURK